MENLFQENFTKSLFSLASKLVETISEIEPEIIKNNENLNEDFNIPINDEIRYDTKKQKIVGTYHINIDISGIHELIMKNYDDHNSTKKQGIFANIDVFKDRIKETQSIIDRKECVKCLCNLYQDLKNIEKNKENYLNKTLKLLEKYDKLKPTKKCNFFEKNKEIEKISNPELEFIIKNYLVQAGEFFPIDIILNNTNLDKCKYCGNKLILITNLDGIRQCSNCDVEYRTIIQNSNDEEISVKINTKDNNYKDRKNFQIKIIIFQGKQDIRIPDDLNKKLDNHFKNVNPDMIGEKIRIKQLNKYGMRGKTSIRLMRETLSKLGYQKYYKDVYLICRQYWGWKLNDISNLELELLNDYDTSQKIIEKYKGRRKSCLNVEYRLYRHLEKIGYDLDPFYFNLMSTKNSLEYHEKIWRKVCSDLKWDTPKPLII